MNTSQIDPAMTGKQDSSKTRQYEQKILDTSSIGVLITRMSDGTILYANKAIGGLLGIAYVDSVIGSPVPNFYWDPEERQLVIQRFRAEGSISQYPLRARRPDNSIVWVSISIQPFNYEGEQVLLSEIVDISERKRVEEALQTSEERFHSLYDNATIGLYRTTPDGRILMINPTGLKLLGFASFEELAKRNLEEAGFEEKDARKNFREKLEREGVIEQESVWTKKDGTPIFVRESSAIFRDENGNILYYDGSFEDITARKKAEEELKRNVNFTNALLDAIPTPVFYKDKEGRYQGCNRAFTDIMGVTPEEIQGKTVHQIWPSENAEIYHQKDLELMRTPEHQVYEATTKDKNGNVRPVIFAKDVFFDEGGNVDGLVGAFIDITERKQSEQALRENQQLLQLVMDNIPQAVFWKDKELTYLGANQSFAEDAGFATPQELVGKKDFDMPWKEQAELFRADDQLVLDGGEPKLNYEEPQTNATGKVTWLRTSKIPMRDANGNIFSVLGMYEDVTERKQLEQQVREAFERRGYQVQVSTEISQEIASASELSELFDRVVTLTKERLGYYHTQLLRYDAAQDAVVLINGYGEIGQKMLADDHKMPMGSGLIGAAAETGQTILRPNLTDDPDWHPNPLLPETKGEIAIPVKFGEEILGVLDVQSDQAGSLTEDDRLLLEGLCGQIAVAIEQTRLRQGMAERLEEVNRLYRAMSHEGWKTYRDTTNLPTGFVFDQTGIKPMEGLALADKLFSHVPMKVMGGEVVGNLSVANDPQHPMTAEDMDFLQQVSDQVALALEGARLSAQTQSALAQTEKLSEAGLLFTRATNLQELVKIAVETLGIPTINRAALETFNYNLANEEVESMDVLANWWNGTGHQTTVVGTRYTPEVLPLIQLFLTPTPMFIKDAFQDERVDGVSLQIVKRLNIHAVAILPLFQADKQIGVLLLESEEIHEFNQDEIRLFSAMGPQISTVMENRRQYERAQQQAERESTLNIISQKIQSATTVEAVLQIAARELGHALGAPMTIAQLNMKDKK